jgi:hypothetical protein
MKLRWMLAAALLVCGAQAPAEQTPEGYPELDPKQLGHVRHIVELANQLPGSWQHMQGGPRGAFDQYQFQLAWMYYALAVTQSQLTPAYRELYQNASDRLIEKMLQPEVWDWWLKVIEIPRFKSYLDPSQDWRDPVKLKNIMYSGHLLQMISLYETLYGDRKYDRPGSLRFTVAGVNGFTSEYSHQSLAELIHKQFVDSDYVGVECEPNLVFTECNQHPILGLLHYDEVHGTRYAEVREQFNKKAAELGYVIPTSQRIMLNYLLKEQKINDFPMAWNDGWTGATWHAWNKEPIEQLYPVHRKAVLGPLLDNTPEHWKVRWGMPTVSTDFGFLAAYAAEVGDEATVRQLLSYADENFHPKWLDGRYFYPRHDVAVPGPAQQITGAEGPPMPGEKPNIIVLTDEQLGDHLVGTLTGNALLPFARLNPGDGLWNLYNRLEASFVRGAAPELVNVRYPEALVTQAYFDMQRGRLVIALKPGTGYRGVTKFNVANLRADGSYAITIDGSKAATLKNGVLSKVPKELGKARWDRSSGMLELELQLQEGRAIAIQEQGAGQTVGLQR